MLVQTFKEFSCFSGLKPNITKFEIVALGPLKGVLDAVCGLKTVDLTNDAIKILGIHLLYHNEIKTERNFLSTVKKKCFYCMEYNSTYLRGKDSNL